MTVGSGCIKKIGQLELKLTGQILDNGPVVIVQNLSC
jgi:hypothetical protein